MFAVGVLYLEGGELDPHGADGNGNPIGGIVIASGTQIAEWTVSSSLQRRPGGS